VSLEISPIKKEHLEDAARLVSIRYQKLLDQVTSLPTRYADFNILIPLLNNLVEAGTGVVALEKGELKGFLAAWLLPSFRRKRSVYSPEWANAVVQSNGRRVYETMYTHLAALWGADGYLTHLVGLLANDQDGLECWRWLGFGMLAADAMRDLQFEPDCTCEVNIRLAGMQDIDAVIALAEALRRHHADSPTFLINDRIREWADYETWIKNPDNAVWLACQGTRAVAFVRIGPANEDACTIIDDEKTASITAAFTEDEVRGEGIATSLLKQSLEWARAQGYARCAVDFEPMNHWARRFWLRYFQPVCYTLIRQIDERIVGSQRT
jgi:GNAT superfamily N-acetyltransferase